MLVTNLLAKLMFSVTEIVTKNEVSDYTILLVTELVTKLVTNLVNGSQNANAQCFLSILYTFPYVPLPFLMVECWNLQTSFRSEKYANTILSY